MTSSLNFQNYNYTYIIGKYTTNNTTNLFNTIVNSIHLIHVWQNLYSLCILYYLRIEGPLRTELLKIWSFTTK